ncbi:unnamed protein product [Eruca vesicaria subsp. sativa]|uniref:FKB95-like N-terminal Kelch domain-containing protein n=1 Tax=Eruca vesicaria subsp. sativa TaxID=29727 RepID=A0ABC8JPN6_ERUVS|nr:unnamed protein product [Eruca vesicaria subsp. sativa]
MKKKLSRKERKRRNKNKNKVCGGLSYLPEDVVAKCLVHLSRLDLAALAMTSKAHRSLNLLSSMGLEMADEAHRAILLQSGSSFMVVDWGIYIIGGLLNGKPTSNVTMFDCFDHGWYKIPPMKMPRAFASASIIDGKLYVFGGCGDDVDSSNWAEVYNFRTYTWDTVCVPPTARPKSIKEIVGTGKKEVYVVDEDCQIFSFSPSKLPPMFVSCGKTDSKPGDREDWCFFGGFIFARGAGGTILWCLPDQLDWKEVKGLEELQQQLVGYDISKLSTNHAHIVIFWNAQPQGSESLELWSAEISLTQTETSQGLEIRGKIEWSGSVYKLDDYTLTDSNRVKVLFAASVYA